MILITGATGRTGGELVRILAERAVETRALVRDITRARAISVPGVEIVTGDLADAPSLDRACAGVERVFLLSSIDPRQVDLQGSAVDAARRAGVRHVVKLSALGADLESPVPFLKWHAQTEKQLEASGLAFTHLRPQYFMQNLLRYAPAIRSGGVLHAPVKDGCVGMVDLRDVAEAAAAVLTSRGHEGKAYELTGPEAVSFADVARTISAATGRRVVYMDVPPAEARRSLVDAGMPEWLADATVRLYGLFAERRAGFVSGAAAELLGRPPRALETFVRDFATEFEAPERAAA